MPPVAAAAAAISAWAATTVTVAGIAVTYGTLAKIAILGGSIAYSSAQNRKLKNQLNASRDTGRDVMVRDPLAFRRYIYGQVLTSGPIAYMATRGTKNEILDIVVMLAARAVEEIGEMRFDNGEVVPLDGAGYATGKYAGYVEVQKFMGTTTQAASGALQAAYPGVWTANHRLQGIAYAHIVLRHNPDLFPNGMPNIKFLVKGHQVYDPRTGLTVWSDNAALCTADYLEDAVMGKGISRTRIKQADLIEAANECDEIVVTDTGTEKRYTLNGTVTSDMLPDGVVRDMCSAMAGDAIDTGGLWTIRAGAYRTPTLDLTDDDLAGPFNVQTRQSRRESYNGVKGTYISPLNQWMATDFPSVKNDTYKAWDGGIRLWKDVSYPFTTSSATVQRLAKVDLERARQGIMVTATYKLKALQAMPLDTVRITRAALGWVNKEFEVKQWQFAIVEEEGEDGEMNIVLAITLTMQETASAVWDWNNGEETTVDLAPNTNLPDPSVVPNMGVITLLTDTTTVIVQPDGSVHPRIKATWALPNNIYIESGGWVQLEYRENGVGNWIPWNRVRGDITEEWITDVKVGLQYQIRGKFENQIGVKSTNWSTTLSATVVGDTVAPNSPGGSLTAVAKPGFVALQWTPSTSNTVNEYEIFRSLVSGVAGFALLANTANSQYEDFSLSTGANAWYYVVAKSRSEISSTASNTAGPVTGLAPSLSAAVPSDPSAPATSGASTTYDATDGSVLARQNITVPALPANAISVNLLVRRNGSSEWTIAGQYKFGSATVVSMDDLTPGTVYDIATQAWSAAGGSNIVTGGNFTAATKSSGPPTYIGGALTTNEKIPPNFTTAGVRRYGFGHFWAEAINAAYAYPKDFSHWEVKCVATGAEGAVDYNWDDGSGTPALYRVTQPKIYFYRDTQQDFNLYFRPVNNSGVAGPWFGSTGHVGANTTKPGGEMMEQEKNNVDIEGGSLEGATMKTASLKTGTVAASSVRDVRAFYVDTDVKALAGGSAWEDFSVNIANRGFLVKPDAGDIEIIGDNGVLNMRNYAANYIYDHGFNSDTTAYISIYRKDGGTMGSGNIRISVKFWEFN